MALKQSIDHARPRTTSPTVLRAHRRARWPGCARAMPTARCRCCACRKSATTSPPSSAMPTLLRDGASDVVFLGTGGSSLGGQTLAQLAGYAVPGVGALRDPPRIHFMDNLDPDSYGALLERLPLATTRFVAISKSGGTGETLMQTIAALDARQGGAARSARSFPRHHRARQARQAQRPARSARRRIRSRMLDHDPGVGGRFSVLTNVGLLPAAVCGLDIGAIRAGAADALAPVLASKPPADVPAAVGAALAVALARRQDDRGDDGLCRPAANASPAGTCSSGPKASARTARARRRSARSGRSTSTASFSSSSPARATSCSPSSPPSPAGRGPRIDRGSRQARRRAGLCRQDHRRSGRGAGPRHRRDARQERLPGAHHPSRTLDERQPRRAADAFHAGDDHRRASARRRSVRPAGGGRRQGAGEEVSRGG